MMTWTESCLASARLSKRRPPFCSTQESRSPSRFGKRGQIQIKSCIVARQNQNENRSYCVRLNRCAKYLLEKDLKEKSEAQRIDSSCAVMTTHSINNLPRSKNTKSAPPR